MDSGDSVALAEQGYLFPAPEPVEAMCKRNAIHEAGHAVVAWCFGVLARERRRRILRVGRDRYWFEPTESARCVASIVPYPDGSLGRVTIARPARRGAARVHIESAINAAGAAAVKVMTGCDYNAAWRGGDLDRRYMDRLHLKAIRRVVKSIREPGFEKRLEVFEARFAPQKEAWPFACAWLEELRLCVEAVADLLLERRELTYQEIEKVILGALPAKDAGLARERLARGEPPLPRFPKKDPAGASSHGGPDGG